MKNKIEELFIQDVDVIGEADSQKNDHSTVSVRRAAKLLQLLLKQ